MYTYIIVLLLLCVYGKVYMESKRITNLLVKLLISAIFFFDN